MDGMKLLCMKKSSEEITKNQKLRSKAYLYGFGSSSSDWKHEKPQRNREKLLVLYIRFLLLAVNDHMCLIKIIWNERKKVKLKK